MSAHARAEAPREGCGLLLGEERGAALRILRAIPLANAAADPRRRYEIAPESFLATEKRAREEGLTVLGVFHSHPEHAAEPSAFDQGRAWPYYAYVILELRGGRIAAIRCWRLATEGTCFEEKAWSVDEEGARAVGRGSAA